MRSSKPLGRPFWVDEDANVRGSGDPEALAGEVVAGIPIRADDRGARPGIAGAAQPTERIVRGADAFGARGAFALAQGRVTASPVCAGRDRAGIAAGAIAIDEALDRGADALETRFAGPAIGIGAAIPGHAAHHTRGIRAAERAIVTDMLVTESGFAGHIAGAGVGGAILHPAAASRTAGDANIAVRAGAAATLALATAQIALRTGAELRDRATEILAIAVSSAAAGIAAFGIAGIGGIEMRMATMFAADLTALDDGLVGRDIAAAILGRAFPGADLVLAAGLRGGIETAARGGHQRLDADSGRWLRSLE